jgi:phage/plasmid-like protein (TIGR03299 family)
MPHEVESMFSYREVPWHGLGTILEEAPDSEQALYAAGLAWAVEKRPIFIADGQDGMVKVAEQFANVRMTDNKVLGIVGKAYNVIQNIEAFRWTDALLGQGCKYETAGSLREGRKVWLSAKLPEPLKVVGDDVDMYLVFSNSHDGNSSVRVAITPIRVVCQNTLTWGLRAAKRTWSIRHTQSLNGKLDEAAAALGMAQDFGRKFQEDADRLANKKISFEEYLDRLLPMAHEDSEGDSRAAQNVKDRREDISRLYLAEDLKQFTGTAWGALQSVADYVSHAEPKRQTETFKERRFEQLVDGHKFLNQAHSLALSIRN